MTAPLATYRVQLRPDWGFDEAANIVGYLDALGVSHLYASPVLQAAPGSVHGYDVTDPARVNDELGGEAGRGRLVEALRAAGLGMIQDIVPNHVALVTPHNPWWWDVLKHGRGSRYADHLDIDWSSGDGRVLVPVLGAPLVSELARGTLQLDEHDGEPAVRYHEHVFPVAPGTESAGDIAAVLDRQHYELAHWRRASRDLNYRRFFDITTLGGVRIEDDQVFHDTHDLVLSWVREGEVDGLRIDHPDGLWDPEAYLERLRAEAPEAWIVVEKILEPGEARRPWPVDGTVGYDFCNQVLGLLTDPAGEVPLTTTYEDLTGEASTWHALVDRGKRQAVTDLLGSEVSRLVRLLADIATAEDTRVADHRLHDAVHEALVAFPVYRTYVRADVGRVDEADVTVIEAALDAAGAGRPDLREPLDLLRRVLTLESTAPQAAELAMRFQQTTGPAMAKGVEDTAFYRFHRLVALNEVGGDPSRFGMGPARFHAANTGRQREWPTTMLLTSTHDTKRSEDVRARLAALSEIPERWDATVRGWYDRNAQHRRPGGPSHNLEYLLYQTLVGAWPISEDRLLPYLEKAAREEKRHTDWHRPDRTYEDAMRGFASRLLADGQFTAEVDALVGSIRDAGWVNSLVQVALKLTSPGVPDVYQGCELWDLSLVDPDNRRDVDFVHRASLLGSLDGLTAGELWARRDEGLPKLALTTAGLRLRRDRPRVFGSEATYEPVATSGERADHVVAFTRSDEVAVVAPRLTVALGEGFGSWSWTDTAVDLPAGAWRDVVTGVAVAGDAGTPVAALLGAFPVAVLAREA